MRRNNAFHLLVILTACAAMGATCAAVNSKDGPTRVIALANRLDGQALRSTADDIDDLQADDAHTQVEAAQGLSVAALNDASRTAVLNALQPHLASDDRTLRLASVNAYAHWATKWEEAKLVKVVASRSSIEAQDGSAMASAAALVGLIRLDPGAADQAVRERMDDFFFRDSSTQALLTMSEMEPAYSATAIGLLKLIDPDNKSVKLSSHDAVTMLASDSASSRIDAANTLKILPFIGSDRATVLEALSSHLRANDGRTRLPFVRAFVHWADEESLGDLQKIVAFPEQASRMSAQEDCWAAAIGGMVRLGAGPAAIDAYNSRVEDRQMSFALQRVLEPLARGTGPSQPLASDLLQQLKVPHAARLKPMPLSNTPNSPGDHV